MGILDDAIREHLDLKRQQGAQEDELKRLEDEAFGPPSRPGDPDFPDTAEDEALGGDRAGADEPAVETPLASDPAAQRTQPPPEATEPPADQPAEPGPDTGEAAVVDEAEVAAEPSGEESPAFYDQTEDGSPEAPVAEPAAPGEPAAADEPPAPAEAGTAEDRMVTEPPPDEPEGLDETGEATAQDAEPAAGEPPIESLDTVEHPGPQPPVESLDTVEHDFGDTLAETGEAEVVEGELAEPDAEEGEGTDEDVLEETPEFLREQPEDDELWFEQGEPKDFDF